jgi:hypothetical protein
MRLTRLLFVALSALARPAAAQLLPGSAEGSSDGSAAAIEAAELDTLMRAMAADAPPAAAEPSARTSAVPALPSFLDIALILDVAASYFDSVGNTWGGGHDPARDGVTLQQLEMSLGAAVDPYFRLDSNLVFTEFGVEVEEAYATTTALPGRLQLRAGQFLSRFGRANPTHPHTWNFADQSLVIGRFFGSEGGRGLGGEVSWLAPLPWYLELVGAVQYTAGECCSRAWLDPEAPGGPPYGPVFSGALKQFFALSPAWSMLLGASWQTGSNGTGYRNDTDLYGTDLFLKWRPVGSPELAFVSLQVEAMHRRRQVPFDLIADWGGYAELTYKPLRRWAFSTRHDLVTSNDRDPLDGAYADLTQRSSLGASFYPSHFSRVRLQGSLVDRDGELGWGVITQLEVVSGAHGTHSF